MMWNWKAIRIFLMKKKISIPSAIGARGANFADGLTGKEICRCGFGPEKNTKYNYYGFSKKSLDKMLTKPLIA